MLIAEKVDFVDNDQLYQVRVTRVRALLSDDIPLPWYSDNNLGLCDLLLCELLITSKFNFDTDT